MRLPVLKTEVTTLSSCDGGSRCPECPLFVKNGGRCNGCSPQHQQAMAETFDNFVECYKECNACTGYKVRVPAICCRSPMKNIVMSAITKGAEDWNKPAYTYTERPRLSFTQRAVFYIASGGVNTIAPGKTHLVSSKHEVVAVNLTRVWGGNGFFSRDLKDYLHLPASTKLVLMTMTQDDLLERGWQKEFYADPSEFQAVGLDAWMPLSFSAYPEEAHMHQYAQLLRTLYCTEKSAAWFVTGDHRLNGMRTDDLILEAVAKIPQMVFNMQFVDDKWLIYHLRIMKHYHSLVKPDAPFWIIGASTPSFMASVRQVVGSRIVYYVSAKPLYLASKGQLLLSTGKTAKSALPKKQLLEDNFSQFSSIVTRYG